MLYEYRKYVVAPGEINELHKVMENQNLPLFEKHGIKPLGFWTPQIGTTGRLHFILAWEDFAERQERWNAYINDPAYKVEQTADGSLLLERTASELWTPTSFSAAK